MRFFNGEQWPQDVQDARQGQQASGGLPPVPARPCLVIDQMRGPIYQVSNQIRAADLGLELVPADDFGEIAAPIDETEIELREGLIRRIQRDPRAVDARMWAAERALQGGEGYYRILTKFLPGKTWDQDLHVERIYNQAAVSLDPAHEQPDGSDAEWAFVGRDMPWAEYKATYPRRAGGRNSLLDYSADDMRSLGDERPGWFRRDGETRSVRVVDYYYTVRDPRTLAIVADGAVYWEDELPDGLAATDTREVIETTIRWAQLDGSDEPPLDETDWPGPDLPIIKVIGEELQPTDDERRCQGMVRAARDSQEGYNAMASKLVESVGLAPIPPWQITEGQIEGYEDQWNTANTRAWPYLTSKSTDLEGKPAERPTRTNVDTPIAAITGALQMFDQGIQSNTQHDPSVGKVNPTLKSGRAISAIIQQDQQGSGHYQANLTRSMHYEAQILNNLLYAIYERPGRLARIVNGQGEPQTLLLHQPSTTAPNGMPQPVPPTIDPLTGQPAPPPPHAKTYTLTKDARFNIAIKVTKSYDTLRQEESSLIGQLVSADPQQMLVYGDLFFKNLDSPGHAEMAKRAKVMLAPPIQALLQSEASGGAPPGPEHQQLQQAQQHIQQLTETLKSQGAAEQVKQQSQQQLGQLKAASAERIVQWQIASRERMDQADREVKIAVAELGAKVDRLALFLEERARVGLQQADAQSQASSQAHDVGLQAMDQAHQAGQAQQAQQAAAAQQASSQQAASAQSDQAHQQQLAQGQQAADQQQQLASQQAAQQPPDGGGQPGPADPGAGAPPAKVNPFRTAHA